jgi:hypothetical protein
MLALDDGRSSEAGALSLDFIARGAVGKVQFASVRAQARLVAADTELDFAERLEKFAGIHIFLAVFV